MSVKCLVVCAARCSVRLHRREAFNGRMSLVGLDNVLPPRHRCCPLQNKHCKPEYFISCLELFPFCSFSNRIQPKCAPWRFKRRMSITIFLSFTPHISRRYHISFMKRGVSIISAACLRRLLFLSQPALIPRSNASA